MMESSTAERGTHTVLIADDTPVILGVVVESLEDRGFRVVVAQDGEEGLQRADFVQPDLILLDVMMPGLDGFEVCRRLKALASTRDIPVIFMTALTETEHKIAASKAGGVDYVTKPLQMDEVMARVGTHLDLRQRDELKALYDKLVAEQKVSERLLLNVLPYPIAVRLKAYPEVIADSFQEATVLFADIVEFTRFSAGMNPERLVAMLDEIASKLGKMPTVAEYHEAMGIINKDAASVYRYMNFDQIEEYAQTAKEVAV